tara:strand:- start:19019 stop:19408 length:390 start_codon:yes stop_codon:yes gene_type:complete
MFTKKLRNIVEENFIPERRHAFMNKFDSDMLEDGKEIILIIDNLKALPPPPLLENFLKNDKNDTKDNNSEESCESSESSESSESPNKTILSPKAPEKKKTDKKTDIETSSKRRTCHMRLARYKYKKVFL